MTSVVGEGQPVTDDVLHSLDLCLGCRACETACPSGVRYGTMVEAFKAYLERSGVRKQTQHVSKEALIGLMRDPNAFAASLRLARVSPRLLGGEAMPPPLSAMLTGKAKALPIMPHLPSRPSVGSLPPLSVAVGGRRYTVCLLEGCVMRVLYDRVNRATVRMLQRAGCDVVCPPQLGCCGALDLHAGFHERGLEVARRFVATLGEHEYDYLISNSAGCGSTLREYGELLQDDPVWSARARDLAAKVRDVSEFLAEIGIPKPTKPFPKVVTYHDACHLAHAQRVREAPRSLLNMVPGIQMVPLSESDMCCGSAGIYNMTQPEMARKLLDRKVGNILQTNAEIVAMGNPGCMAWIDTGLRERGAAVEVLHVMEILDACFEDRLSPTQ